MAYFKVLPYGVRVPNAATDRAFLLTDNWDDWFKFSTLYGLVIFDEVGERHPIGGVKIGQFNMADDQRRASIPNEFDQLGSELINVQAGFTA
jgi:hypothetical protein